jgi:retron-type reverse transcriptase
MKRIGFLFEKTFTKESLFEAYLIASKGKHKKKQCFEFEKNLASNIDELYESIHNGSYKPKEYFKFEVYEPKKRTIYAPAFKDIVVQHAIYKTIYPIFDKTFIDQSYACRVGYGAHKAADYAQESLRKSFDGSYTIKLDIRKFFYRIDRNILRKLIEKKIKDKRFVDIMMIFCDYSDLNGIPIGNLLSQIYALIFLNPLDHFIKRELKIKHYCRYVDDFVLFNLTLDQCKYCLCKIKNFLNEKLNLQLSRYTIARTTKGMNFVGYRTWRSKRFIRKRSLYIFRKALKNKSYLSLASCLGHAKRTHSLKRMLTMIKEEINGNNLSVRKIH